VEWGHPVSLIIERVVTPSCPRSFVYLLSVLKIQQPLDFQSGVLLRLATTAR
jgi:hypothetical protein